MKLVLASRMETCFCWVKCFAGSRPLLKLRSRKPAACSGRETWREVVLTGSTATTWIMECLPKSFLGILITPSLSGTRFKRTLDESARKSRLEKPPVEPPGLPSLLKSAKGALGGGMVAPASPALLRWNSSPPTAACSPVWVERITQGFKSSIGLSSMLPGYFFCPLRSST